MPSVQRSLLGVSAQQCWGQHQVCAARHHAGGAATPHAACALHKALASPFPASAAAWRRLAGCRTMCCPRPACGGAQGLAVTDPAAPCVSAPPAGLQIDACNSTENGYDTGAPVPNSIRFEPRITHRDIYALVFGSAASRLEAHLPGNPFLDLPLQVGQEVGAAGCIPAPEAVQQPGPQQ